MCSALHCCHPGLYFYMEKNSGMQKGDPCRIFLCVLPALTFHFARLKFLLYLLLGFPTSTAPSFLPKA